MAPKIQPLLSEFREIVVDDLLVGLSSLRSISNQIDLIPGSRLPNKAPYWMTSVESEDVDKQVQELLEKVWI